MLLVNRTKLSNRTNNASSNTPHNRHRNNPRSPHKKRLLRSLRCPVIGVQRKSPHCATPPTQYLKSRASALCKKRSRGTKSPTYALCGSVTLKGCVKPHRGSSQPGHQTPSASCRSSRGVNVTALPADGFTFTKIKPTEISNVSLLSHMIQTRPRSVLERNAERRRLLKAMRRHSVGMSEVGFEFPALSRSTYHGSGVGTNHALTYIRMSNTHLHLNTYFESGINVW
ncbi:hypothetical protein K493DRAFT_70263 [Basidiobolus meristosporus CBS 931.73]|uniref:Uncharacterized protein n=1 Tax=Basidiobolus meristosporus CBS 931.73 TaxID=1314790 RepID=A0A1Y1XU06_9FUNG|nr:hypothetical protein K493DRAFT_70263 [Basidiobolus meristosporus CBS 931.73]|eukprot:ORX89247.1 hypothetical protein K493DRAFT_70263 [Basidiobolus meristosporus CBS 931.73]